MPNKFVPRVREILFLFTDTASAPMVGEFFAESFRYSALESVVLKENEFPFPHEKRGP
jgi:hypothetical protein